MGFTHEITVGFHHCDPAGIVFYPRYFDMVNSAVEKFFADHVGQSIASIILEQKRGGTPAAKVFAEFKRPSRLGDVLKIRVGVERIGNSSADLEFRVWCEEELRVVCRKTIVWTDRDVKPEPWPPEIRAKLVEANSWKPKPSREEN
ncbi:MAG: thioesterase family protein [Albidovulum sp.]|nr:thioesterase family protein [Albidovulum sp.]